MNSWVTYDEIRTVIPTNYWFLNLSCKPSIYIRTVSSYRLLSALLNWFILICGSFGAEQHAKHSISAQTSHKWRNQCTKTKELLKSYSLIYILCCRVGNRLQTTWNAGNRSGNIPNPRIMCPEPMVGALREEGTTSKIQLVIIWSKHFWSRIYIFITYTEGPPTSMNSMIPDITQSEICAKWYLIPYLTQQKKST